MALNRSGSDIRRSMAMPMKSRQSSTTSLSDQKKFKATFDASRAPPTATTATRFMKFMASKTSKRAMVTIKLLSMLPTITGTSFLWPKYRNPPTVWIKREHQHIVTEARNRSSMVQQSPQSVQQNPKKRPTESSDELGGALEETEATLLHLPDRKRARLSVDEFTSKLDRKIEKGPHCEHNESQESDTEGNHGATQAMTRPLKGEDLS